MTTDFRVEDRYRSRTPDVLDLIERGEPAVCPPARKGQSTPPPSPGMRLGDTRRSTVC